MIDAQRVTEWLSSSRGQDVDLGENPTRAELREVVLQYKKDGLCGRRIAEQRLGPYFIASPTYGQRELDLLEEILAEEYEGTDFCVRGRHSECSRLRGGCKNS